MKLSPYKLLVAVLLWSLIPEIQALSQTDEGVVKVDRLYSSLLENEAGENPTRRVSIYLPPGYEDSEQRYPVIYYLHGFTWSDSLDIAVIGIQGVFDKGIREGKIRPVIIVMPNHYTNFRGSFYTNSSYTGKWADFTAKDLVAYIDENYRTIPDRLSRGIAGHSMGGHGAIKLGFSFPEVFANVYSLSGAAFALTNELDKESPVYASLNDIKSVDQLITGYDYFLENAIIAMGQAFSPNPNKAPFFADVPYTSLGNRFLVNEKILLRWQRNMPLYMVDSLSIKIKSLNALMLDWGRNEENPHIPVTNRLISIKLEQIGFEHYAEEYIGDHVNKLYTDDGRLLNDMFPFFDRVLKFE